MCMPMPTTGPNDARRVVWALGAFFFYFSIFFNLFNPLARVSTPGLVFRPPSRAF